MKSYMLRIPSKVNEIKEVETIVNKLVSDYNVSEDKYPNILISLTEAVNNAIIHGNNKDENKYVNINLERTNAGLSIRVSDEGAGFNLKTIPDPTSPDHVECCGGRGVFLIQQLTDRVLFLNNGSTVEMHFNI